MRFPVNFVMLKSGIARAGRRFYTRIIGVLGVVALVGLLQACSVMKIFYNQAPELVYWYLDGHLNLTGEQSLQLKGSLSQLQAWHRQTQLPAYINALQQLQQQLPSDITAAAACSVFADVRRKLAAVSERAEPLAAALVGTLNASQLTQLEQKFARNNADEEGVRLDGNPTTGQDKRYRQAVSRAESLYGTLDDRQLAVIAQRLDPSRFDFRLSLAEKLRRQRDTLQTLQPLTAGQSSPEQALAALRGLVERTLSSPNPVYRVYIDRLTRENCQTFADLHNSTTAAQRGKAVETLRIYEQDFRALNAQRS